MYSSISFIYRWISQDWISPGSLTPEFPQQLGYAYPHSCLFPLIFFFFFLIIYVRDFSFAASATTPFYSPTLHSDLTTTISLFWIFAGNKDRPVTNTEKQPPFQFSSLHEQREAAFRYGSLAAAAPYDLSSSFTFEGSDPFFPLLLLHQIPFSVRTFSFILQIRMKL